MIAKYQRKRLAGMLSQAGIPPAESGPYCQHLWCNLLFRSRTIQPVRDDREPCSARDKTLEGLSDLISHLL